MEWLTIGLWTAGGLVGIALLALAAHLYIVRRYLTVIARIFQEMPPFRPPAGDPTPDAEEVVLPTADGLALHGIYLKAGPPRRGVILFGLEYGSNRWAAVPYTDFLRQAGYDVVAFEMRGQGETPAQPTYRPMQWVTEFDVDDVRTVLAYLKGRPDRDDRGVGFYGLSKGGGAGLMAAAHDAFVRCFVTDGVFATVGTMVPYMKHWIDIYVHSALVARMIPDWYLTILARIALREVARQRGCHYPSLQRRMARLAPRPLLMIHGAADKYIKPAMAKRLFALAREPKTFWLVDKAKHNQAFHVAHEEYKARLLAFFDQHLAGGGAARHAPAARNGTPLAPQPGEPAGA